MSQKRGMAGQVGHAKKAKNEDDEDTPTFEDHLAGLDDEDWGDDAPMEGEHRQALRLQPDQRPDVLQIKSEVARKSMKRRDTSCI